MQDASVVLGATVEMRRDANRKMIAAIDNNDSAAFKAAQAQHKHAERLARPYRMKTG